MRSFRKVIILAVTSLLIFWSFTCAAQIKINEIMSSNSSTIFDEDGDFSDWIEIVNTGNEIINLEGYGLSDNSSRPYKWVFPDYEIEPGEYLLIWASGKDRKPPKSLEVNGLYRDLFLNIPGTSVDQLINDPRYPDEPNVRGILSHFFESPVDVGDNYGQAIYALLQAPMTGDYQFWVSGDDNTSLFLSEDDNRENLRKIAEVPEWTHPREWDKFSQQRSALIRLEAGKRYFMLALMKEGYGGDHVAVQWQLPNGVLESPMSTQHLFIKGAKLHTNYSISAAGEPILLTDPSGVLIDHFNETPIPTNFSYGRYPDKEGPLVFFNKPTPEKANNYEGFSTIQEKPRFLTNPGVYVGNVEIQMQCPGENSVIFYSIDGSEPQTGTSNLYIGPIQLSSTQVIRAICSKAGSLDSEIAAGCFNIVPDQISGFSSNLPLLIINQFDQIIGNVDKSPAYLTLVDRTPNGRYALANSENLNARVEIEIRGSSSQSFPKKGYGLHIVNENGSNRKENLLGMPEEHNWILHGPYSDKSLMRNAISYELAAEMGNYAPRVRFVEMFLHSGNGPLTEENYHGVYLLVERIKIAPGRLDLAELSKNDNAEPNITGGYIFKKDRLNPGDTGFHTSRNNHYVYVRPQERDMTPPQKAWLTNYMDEVDKAIFSSDFKDKYPEHIDPATFIDFHLMTELAKEIDGYRLSTFFYKDRNGLLKLGPVWDYNLSWGNANYLEGWDPEGWYYPLITQYDYLNGWFTRLFQDEKFEKEYKERYTRLRKTVFSNEHIISKIRGYESLLSEAAGRNFTRWPIMGQYVWPNWFIASAYSDEIDWMVDWIEKRLIWMDGQLLIELNEEEEDELIHYWNFNLTSDFLTPSYTLGGAALDINPGVNTEITTGTGQNFNAVNARFGDDAGAHLRVNNPIGSELLFYLPSTNFEDLSFKYEARRSGSGANRQYISYTSDGESYIALDTILVMDNPRLYTYELKNIIEINNNPDFKIKISIDQINDGTGGDVGNNRFDNVTLEGKRIEGTNQPPLVINTIPFTELVAESGEVVIALDSIFRDPEGEELSFRVQINNDWVAESMIHENTLRMTGHYQGEGLITVTAGDPLGMEASTQFRIMVYPKAFTLQESDFEFTEWDQNNQEWSYPENMIFLQSDKSDPEIEDVLQHAYYIPHGDYAADEMINIGFPYRNKSRTRINGLGAGGISFINTGRGRDLGAAVLNIDTRGLSNAFLSFIAGTMRPNSRVYHLRLQYRVGLDGAWVNFTDGQGNFIEYSRSSQDGHIQDFENIRLSNELLNQENLFIKWKYYYTGERISQESGARTMIRLDDISVKSISHTEDGKAISDLFIYPNPLHNSIAWFSEVTSGTLYNIQGKELMKIEEKQYITTQDLVPGMYIYKSLKGHTLKLVVL
jgi:hypothetical protein